MWGGALSCHDSRRVGAGQAGVQREEKPAHAYRDGKRETCHQEAPYGSVTIVCNEHKWGLRIGTDDGKARPFAGLKFYGLETRALGEARQYE